MRITRETLLRIARTTALLRSQRNRHLVCIYLTGSLLSEEPLLGGVTDIDLVFVHDSDPPCRREVERVSDELHLDIAHYPQTTFHQPRRLRTDPWLGSFLCQNPIVLHEIQHWFEFTQASVCAQFYRPENTMERTRPQAEQARQIWLELHTGQNAGSPQATRSYLKALELAANAIACLNGPPLAERRFLIHFPERAEQNGFSRLAGELANLIGLPAFPTDRWAEWRTEWQQTLQRLAGQENCPISLHPVRQAYYLRAADALLEPYPAAALWLLVRTWSLALCCLPAEDAGPAWQELTQTLELDKPHFADRVSALDIFLDHVEEALDTWAQRNGV